MASMSLSAGGRRRASGMATMMAAVMGLLVAMLVVNGVLQSSKGEDEYMLVQMGMGAEEENDKMLINALGAEDGDTTKEVEEMTEEEVLAAEEATQEGVDEEINNALADAESAAKATYESDIEKYKSQEAGMGHSGWVQSWARARRSVGLAQPVRRAEMQQLAMAQRRTRRARSSSVPIPL
ncbi:hypothetical protein GUITHDRAFT_151197 [Guillardia theta CCMP2712]|uniref:Uncharacterized protein n=1 Tax=Guillardia theta (strain CCMP2712) TaxID=905079 RepID=L1JPT0_GUITC|nr:hypothetical protein GUITHDRAFT_151197 [Guillardia theta CCMP2712]EKX50601.1 hypothetical protein GUITHDRAFT_151197 [Guillardia theta CCMP2712]|eukprot:XP_005837581.1 hypothetical protein GUITHDRAFT_151197 [Guillardia theta CCMP2712]